MPMFPLGSVLLPGMVIPLHVFEPRYRQLVDDCLGATRTNEADTNREGVAEFGVTLIERGSEVGGGDVRTDVGTVARVVEAGMFEDGRWYLVVVGTRRVRVVRWLDDDPYPRADVEDWPDDDAGAPPDTSREADLDVEPRLRRVLALRAELGQAAAPATLALAEDPTLATWQAAGAAGFGPLDLQQVLSVPSAAARRELVAELLAEAELVLRAQLEAP
jgi:Lon protease-like protein